MITRNMLTGVACLLLVSLQSAAATITYDVTSITGNTWEYNYTVNNNTLGFNIEEFTVYFDFGVYENLSLITAPATWDPLLVEPDNFFSNDGSYDALALNAGIAPGYSLGIFSVRFDYLGAGTPGSQYFEIVNSSTFDVLDSGRTSPVPIPAAVWLFGSGLLGLIGVAIRKKA